MSVRSLGSLFSLVLVLIVASTPAAKATAQVAAQAAMSLRYDAPAVCPGASALRAEVERMLPRDASPTRDVAARVDVRELDGEGYVLVLELSRDGVDLGRRSVGDVSCELVVETAALVIALAIDPAAALLAPQPSSQPSSPAATAVDPRLVASVVSPGPSPFTDCRDASCAEPLARPEPNVRPYVASRANAHDSPESGEPRRISMRAAMLIEAGALPGIGAGATVAAGLDVGPVVLEIEGVLLPARHARVDNHATAGGSVGLASVAGAVAWPAVRGAVDVGPTAAVEVGWASGEGEGVSDPASGGGLFVGGRGGIFVAGEVTAWLAVRADAQAVVALRRPTFVLDGVGEVHEPSLLSGRLGIGAEVRFP